MCKAAERLLRLYMVTTALNAGSLKQLLARKVHVHKYGGLSCNFLTFLDVSKWKWQNLSCVCYLTEGKITDKSPIEENDKH